MKNIFSKMKNISMRKRIILAMAVIALSLFSKTVFAVWNGTFYNPGATLNPECLPTDPNCDVLSPLTSTNISDVAYGVSWNTDATHAPSKNAVYNEVQTLVASNHNPVTLGTANGLSLATQVLSLALASTSTTGALSNTDWNTFNNKQNTGLSVLLDQTVGQTVGTTGARLTKLWATNLDVTNPITGSITGSSGSTTGNAATVTTNANLTGPITSVGNATSIASQTGIGTKFVVDTTPTFVTNITDPLIIGGTGTTSALSLRSTSGIGAAGADIIFQTGNNGATETMRILNNGNVGIGTTGPGAQFEVNNGGTTVLGVNGGTSAGANGVYARYISSDNNIAFYDTAAHAKASGATGRNWYADNTGILRLNGSVSFAPTGGDVYSTFDTILARAAAANLRLGDVAGAAPVAQTLSVQNVVAGTTNTAGANFTIAGSQGTGTGTGGSIIFQTAPAGSTGTAVNALSTALTILGSGNVILGVNTASATSTPLNVSFGGTYGTNTPGSQANLKWDMYNAAGTNRYGIGMSAGLMEFQAGSNNDGNFAWYTGSGTERMRLNTSGNLGIGTAAPLTRLSAVGAGTLIAGSINYLGEFKSSDTTAGKGVWFGYDTSTAVSYIGNTVPGGATTDLGFITWNGSSWLERMRITSSGNVGIGTPGPSYPLVVEKDAIAITPTTSTQLQNATLSTAVATQQFSPSLQFTGHAWNTTVTAADNQLDAREYLSVTSGTTPTSALTWGFQRAGGGYTDQMVLTSAGNLGIGTSTPNNTIQVANLIDFNNTDLNTKLGYQAGKNIVAGAAENTFVGYQAGISNAVGGTSAALYNSAFGSHSFVSNTTGTSNVGVGAYVLQSNTTGSYNAVNGMQAMQSNTTGSNNTASGYFSLQGNTTGNNNVAFGYSSLVNVGTSSNNTAIGTEALRFAAGSGNVALGYRAGYNETGSNAFYINNVSQGSLANDKAFSLLYGTFSGTAGSLTGQQLVINGNVGIGQATPVAKLDILDTALAGSGALAGSVLNLAQTWNTTGAPTAIKLNVTNTASGAASLLADLQVGGVSKLSIDKNGFIKTSVYKSNGVNLTGMNRTDSALEFWDQNGATAFDIRNDGQLRISGAAGASVSNILTLYSGVGFWGGSIARNDAGSPYLLPLPTSFTLNTVTATNKGFIIQGVAAQSGNLQEWQTSAGAVSVVDKNGYLGLSSISPSGPLSVTPLQYNTGTASQSLTTVTGVGTTWTSAMVGSQFVFANGVSAGTITAFGSATSLTVTASQTVASQAYTISYTGLQVGSTGNIGIGTTSPAQKLDILGATGDTTVLKVSTTGGNSCTFSTTSGLFSCASDIRLKHDISSLPDNTVSKLAELNPVTYHYNWQNQNDPLVPGFIAQEFEKTFPNMVFTDPVTGYKSLSYTPLLPYAIKAIQELNLDLNAVSGTITPIPSSTSESFAVTFFKNIFSHITTWLADAKNGIGYIFAGQINTKSLCVSDDAGGKTCITKAKLDALLSGATATAGQSSSAIPAPDPKALISTPPPTSTPAPTPPPPTPAPTPTPTSPPSTTTPTPAPASTSAPAPISTPPTSPPPASPSPTPPPASVSTPTPTPTPAPNPSTSSGPSAPTPAPTPVPASTPAPTPTPAPPPTPPPTPVSVP